MLSVLVGAAGVYSAKLTGKPLSRTKVIPGSYIVEFQDATTVSLYGVPEKPVSSDNGLLRTLSTYSGASSLWSTCG